MIYAVPFYCELQSAGVLIFPLRLAQRLLPHLGFHSEAWAHTMTFLADHIHAHHTWCLASNMCSPIESVKSCTLIRLRTDFILDVARIQARTTNCSGYEISKCRFACCRHACVCDGRVRRGLATGPLTNSGS